MSLLLNAKKWLNEQKRQLQEDDKLKKAFNSSKTKDTAKL
jgi:hypothetical protein